MTRLAPEARRLAARAMARERYRSKVEAGECCRCARPRLPDSVCCAVHRHRLNETARRSYRRRVAAAPHDPEHPERGYLDRVQTGRQHRPDPGSHHRTRLRVPTRCPKCAARLLALTVGRYEGGKCPNCGYFADQYMLWNQARQRAGKAIAT